MSAQLFFIDLTNRAGTLCAHCVRPGGRAITSTTAPSALWAFDLATSVFLLLVRHSINKFILCSYFERRLP